MMQPLRQKIIDSRYFFFACLGLLLMALLLTLIINKADLFLALTPWHAKWGDYFFVAITQLGNGLFAIALVLFLIWRKKYQVAALLLCSFLLSGLTAQIIKNLVSELRPYGYFQTLGITIHAIEGETAKASSASFPSGHTATVFSILCSLVMMVPSFTKNWIGVLLFALLVAYSRMYVSNHFLIDLAGGALLGISASFFSYWLVRKLVNRKQAAKRK